jgi:hypothetical protein
MAIAAKDNAIRALDIEVALADRCAMHSPPSCLPPIETDKPLLGLEASHV